MPIGTCRLCRELRSLQDSHLIPRAVYRYLRISDGRNPFFLTTRNAVQTSKQVTTFLLCAECEERFNSNGERWMLRTGYRGHGRFRLREALLRTTPIDRTSNSQVFSSSRVPEIEVPRLIYFASSVFWRAAVHDWGGSSDIQFGTRYESEFRGYLLGQLEFPSNASLVVHVSSVQKPVDFFSLPSGSRQDGFFQYEFIALGIAFRLLLGGKVPSEFRQLCIVHSPEGPIFLTDKVEEYIIESAAALLTPTT